MVEQRSARGSRRVSEAIVRDPQPGATIGRYTIVRLIARGGVGLVYLARQSLSNAAVVVKVLAGNFVGDAETTARFDREAQRLRGVQHPNIVTMVDYGHAQVPARVTLARLAGEHDAKGHQQARYRERVVVLGRLGHGGLTAGAKVCDRSEQRPKGLVVENSYP